MDINLRRTKEILKKYNQEHLIRFYEELDEEEKKGLIKQIKKTNFSYLEKIYTKSIKDDRFDYNTISPIKYIVKSKIEDEKKNEYISIGENIVRNGKLAIITLAGGQGTRLGYSGPKGCYEIDVPPKKSLFEFICDKLKIVYYKYGIFLNWYIMTSEFNDKQTKKFFLEKRYFGYPKEKVYFFKQDTLEIIDKKGKVVLDNLYTLKKASNGNGDVFKAFYRASLEKTLDEIEWIFISGIDNIILEIIDPLFIGIAKSNNSPIAAKSIEKKDLDSKEWVFANIDNRVNIIDPKNLSETMRYSKSENGLYNYNQINILSHLFSKKAFLQASKLNLPYHRAFKKNDYVNEDGIKVVATEPNTFKFEKFIFDVFKYYKNFTLLEVEEKDEFAPIKAFTGMHTPEIALEKYLQKMRENI